MPQFRIKYDLLDGTFVGYHADSICTITTNPNHAKLHRGPADRATTWLEQVRENFKFGWDESEENFGFIREYRENSCWKGCGHDQIHLTLEEVT